MTRPRLVIGDDHTLVVEALAALLAPECDVLAKVCDGRALVRSALERRPDVVLVDVGLPLLNGLDAARQIHQSAPAIRIVFLTMNEDPDVAAAAFRAGASAYLLKRSAGAELLAAIREVLLRRTYVTPLVAGGVMTTLMHDPESGGGARALTARQREVLQLLAEGKSMKEAAAILSVDARTVAFHKYRIMDQLHIRTNAALIRFAVEQHLVA